MQVAHNSVLFLNHFQPSASSPLMMSKLTRSPHLHTRPYPTPPLSHRSTRNNNSSSNISCLSPCTTLQPPRRKLVPTKDHFSTPHSPFLCRNSPSTGMDSFALSPVALSRDWSLMSDPHDDHLDDDTSSVCSSMGSSVAPSPSTRIRAMLHRRQLLQAVPRLSGSAYTLAISIFDALATISSGKPPATTTTTTATTTSAPSNTRSRVSAAFLAHDTHELHDEENLADCAIPLPQFLSLVQNLTSSLVANPNTSLHDKMFMTNMLCEGYKLKHDVYYNDLVTAITTAETAVANLMSHVTASNPRSMEGENSKENENVWSCDRVLNMMLTAATQTKSLSTQL